MAKTKQQIRVLLADDHAIFRDGLRKLLGSDEDIVIVGEAFVDRLQRCGRRRAEAGEDCRGCGDQADYDSWAHALPNV